MNKDADKPIAGQKTYGRGLRFLGLAEDNHKGEMKRGESCHRLGESYGLANWS